jgi:HAD superfamily hydrolase (TIGR01509 family)
MPTAVLDIDGTLVDSNYHHVLAWDRAFAGCRAKVPLWQIHRHMGMGGDRLVAELLGEGFEAQHGDHAREAEERLYGELLPEVRAVEGAREAISWLSESGWTVILASSAKSGEVDHYIGLLGAEDLVDEATDSDDVEQTKPAVDLIDAALEKAQADSREAIVVGDSVWDVEAAGRAGVASIAVLSGGFPESDLKEAGAAEVIESVAQLPRLISGRPRLGQATGR